MTRGLAVALLVCAGRAAASPAVPTTDRPAPSSKPIATLEENGYDAAVYEDGLVAWSGRFDVQSIGTRFGRVPVAQVEALAAAFEDIKPEPVPEHPACGKPITRLRLDRGAKFIFYDDDHCRDEAWLTRLQERFRALAGLDTWIRGNPPAPDGPLPGGDHLLLYYTSGCRGPCPYFDVTLFDEGTLLWNGGMNVAARGERRATVPADRMRALVDAFAADPGGHDRRGDPDFCSASPLVTIRYRHDGRRDDRTYDRCDGLPRPLEEQIVALTGIGSWIQVPAELLRYECPSYVVTVDETGQLAWTGREHVAVAGERSAKLRPDQLVALGAILEKARGKETDACPSTARAVLTYARAGARRQVCAAEALEPEILAATEIGAWVRQPRPIVQLRQGACLGRCPSYLVTVYDDGTAVWRGDGNVAALGERRALLGAAQLRALRAAFHDSRFLEGGLERPSCRTLRDGTVECRSTNCTDTSHTIIKYSEGERSRLLDDDHCEERPRRARLEETVRRLLGLDAWIGRR